MEGFPRHDTEPMTEATLNQTILLHGDQTPWERGYTKKELNEKRRVYCDRCVHEQFFLVYTETDVRCRLCGVSGPRGTALTHVLEGVS
jgi:ribosomal protein S27E